MNKSKEAITKVEQLDQELFWLFCYSIPHISTGSVEITDVYDKLSYLGEDLTSERLQLLTAQAEQVGIVSVNGKSGETIISNLSIDQLTAFDVDNAVVQSYLNSFKTDPPKMAFVNGKMLALAQEIAFLDDVRKDDCPLYFDNMIDYQKFIELLRSYKFISDDGYQKYISQNEEITIIHRQTFGNDAPLASESKTKNLTLEQAKELAYKSAEFAGFTAETVFSVDEQKNVEILKYLMETNEFEMSPLYGRYVFMDDEKW